MNKEVVIQDKDGMTGQKKSIIVEERMLLKGMMNTMKIRGYPTIERTPVPKGSQRKPQKK